MFRLLERGELAPSFFAPALNGNPRYAFDTAAGRYVLLLLYGSATYEPSAVALGQLAAYRHLFDDENACFFGVTSDPEDVSAGRIAPQLPGVRWFLDYDRAVARRFGAISEAGQYLPHWLLFDPMMRVVAMTSINEGASILSLLETLLKQPKMDLAAPVLIAPRVFEPEMCQRLIALYESCGGRPSGFMREVDGVTVGIYDDQFKRRRDYDLDGDSELRAEIRNRFTRILLPQIQRVFQFKVTRIERYIVACYDGDERGYFRAHRDNTTAGTAHRRFACSINLNAEDYEGGDLRFAEYGSRLYRPPTGGAVVFSCSLLHEATPVTRGKRYAYLPFFYDEEGARIREAAAKSDSVTKELANYRAGGTPQSG